MCSDVPGWASSPEPVEPSLFKPKPGLTHVRAWSGLGPGLKSQKPKPGAQAPWYLCLVCRCSKKMVTTPSMISIHYTVYISDKGQCISLGSLKYCCYMGMSLSNSADISWLHLAFNFEWHVFTWLAHLFCKEKNNEYKIYMKYQTSLHGVLLNVNIYRSIEPKGKKLKHFLHIWFRL